MQYLISHSLSFFLWRYCWSRICQLPFYTQFPEAYFHWHVNVSETLVITSSKPASTSFILQFQWVMSCAWTGEQLQQRVDEATLDQKCLNWHLIASVRHLRMYSTRKVLSPYLWRLVIEDLTHIFIAHCNEYFIEILILVTVVLLTKRISLRLSPFMTID